MKPKKNSHSSRNVHREPKSYKAQLLRAHLAKKAPFISKISPIIGLRYISFHKFFSRAKKLNFSSVAFKNHYTQWLDKRREGGMGIRSCFQFTHTKITRSFGGPRAALGATATQTLRMISQYSAKPFIVSKSTPRLNSISVLFSDRFRNQLWVKICVTWSMMSGGKMLIWEHCAKPFGSSRKERHFSLGIDYCENPSSTPTKCYSERNSPGYLQIKLAFWMNYRSLKEKRKLFFHLKFHLEFFWVFFSTSKKVEWYKASSDKLLWRARQSTKKKTNVIWGWNHFVCRQSRVWDSTFWLICLGLSMKV